MRDLTRSLEFSQAEVKDLQSRVSELERKDSINRDAMGTLKKDIGELEQRSNYQEDYNRRCNLRFSGVPEQRGGETWEVTADTVTKLIKEKLQLPPMKIERAHRTGQASPIHGRPRTIVTKFERFGDREAVVRNAKKLRGTGIFVNDDLCPASLELRKNQMPQLRQAKEDGKIAFFRHTKLIIREKSEVGGGVVPVSRDGGDVKTATRQSLPAPAGGRAGAAAARVEIGAGVADSDDGATTSVSAAGGAAASVSAAGVDVSPAGGVPSPGRGYAAVASAGARGMSGVGEGAKQRPPKYLRSGRK